MAEAVRAAAKAAAALAGVRVAVWEEATGSPPSAVHVAIAPRRGRRSHLQPNSRRPLLRSTSALERASHTARRCCVSGTCAAAARAGQARARAPAAAARVRVQVERPGAQSRSSWAQMCSAEAWSRPALVTRAWGCAACDQGGSDGARASPVLPVPTKLSKDKFPLPTLNCCCR